MNKYPEHEKLAKVKDKSQAIGEFLEWLQERYTIASYNPVSIRWDSIEETAEPVEDGDAKYPIYRSVPVAVRGLLAEYLGIDENKLEREKQQMLKELQSIW